MKKKYKIDTHFYSKKCFIFRKKCFIFWKKCFIFWKKCCFISLFFFVKLEYDPCICYFTHSRLKTTLVVNILLWRTNICYLHCRFPDSEQVTFKHFLFLVLLKLIELRETYCRVKSWCWIRGIINDIFLDAKPYPKTQGFKYSVCHCAQVLFLRWWQMDTSKWEWKFL